jgi:hypothetical protein
MGLRVRDLLIAAGHATAEDPLLDMCDAWAVVTAEITQRLTRLPEWDAFAPAQRTTLVTLLQWLQREHTSPARTTAAPPHGGGVREIGDLGETGDDAAE